jgi:hypothetical protein
VLEGLAPWFWRSVVPTLPDSAKVVVAGRRPPAEPWRQDPAFRECALVLALRNLPPEDAAVLARARGVSDESLVGQLVRATHGHPLALVIATDTSTGSTAGRPHGVLLDHPDAAARLLGRFLDEAITPLQREALHVCGHARRVDRGMLREVLDIDEREADELLAWLRQRPYAESRPDGLTLHDVVKDALERDLRWRDREAFRRLHRRIRQVILERMARAHGLEQHRLAGDLVYMHHGNATAQDYYSFADADALVARPLRADDADERDWVVDTLQARERRGRGAAWWLDHGTRSWLVFEDALGERAGVTCTAHLEELPPDAFAVDPLLADLLEAIRQRRPPEPGEVVLHQFFAPREDDRDLLPRLIDHLAAASLHEWIVPRLGWVVFGTLHTRYTAPIWTYIGFEELARVQLDGHDVAIWGRDFGRSPFTEWFTAMAEVEIDDTGTVPPPVSSPIALSRAEFGPAVRVLLKDLQDPARLRRSPLLGSRLATPGESGESLVRRVRQAVDRLARMPRSDTAARVLDRTFLRPAGSQERAAEVLDLPFSTYRRHLAAGLERLEDLLWDWELHGPPPLDSN